MYLIIGAAEPNTFDVCYALNSGVKADIAGGPSCAASVENSKIASTRKSKKLVDVVKVFIWTGGNGRPEITGGRAMRLGGPPHSQSEIASTGPTKLVLLLSGSFSTQSAKSGRSPRIGLALMTAIKSEDSELLFRPSVQRCKCLLSLDLDQAAIERPIV